LVVVALFSFNASRHGVAWSGFSLEWYRSLPGNELAIGAMKNSLTLAVSSAGRGDLPS